MSDGERALLTMLQNLHGDMSAGFVGVNTRLDALTGRIAQVETKAALLDQRAGQRDRLCEDRQKAIGDLETKIEDHVTGNKTAAKTWGALVGGVVAALIEVALRLPDIVRRAFQ